MRRNDDTQRTGKRTVEVEPGGAEAWGKMHLEVEQTQGLWIMLRI